MEVAQVTAVDMEDVFDEDEHEACEVEKEDADVAQEDGAPKEEEEEAKAERRTRRTRTKRKEDEEEAVNGVPRDGETNTSEDQNASELTLKKEVSDAKYRILPC